MENQPTLNYLRGSIKAFEDFIGGKHKLMTNFYCLLGYSLLEQLYREHTKKSTDHKGYNENLCIMFVIVRCSDLPNVLLTTCI